ncbi:hypothetical protein ASG40_17390 [Methylobacterium sp. Leaf399]|uniref:hypothetical protein n=1 Tax=unclassified Methylobacterium TaxID=2615210 RepID=UPI0007017E79|nr:MULTISPECIES: hypothetical protein [unclassified Methylobacterium]KQT17163.1 hypothetical protein ASG40_17390 [Methylobacterium sp. Leaf399]KQT77699.1 hypothetical protein ASG59_10150 [Methylobacterium sp. Leaf466]
MRPVLFALVLAMPQAASAEEPLVLRIRPHSEAPEGIGSGRGEADEAARRAFQAREAIWERSNARARIVIASICRGCLKDLPPAVPDRSAAQPQPRTSPPP